MLRLVSAIVLSRLATPHPVARRGLDRVMRATVPLHAEDWVNWDRVCLMPKPGWCFSAAPHKGTTGGGWKEAPCGKRPCWVVDRTVFGPNAGSPPKFSAMRRFRRGAVPSCRITALRPR